MCTVPLRRFSAKVLTALCDQINGIPISGIVVVGDGQAARSIALSGNAMKVPVLWARGGTAQLQENSEVSVMSIIITVILWKRLIEFQQIYCECEFIEIDELFVDCKENFLTYFLMNVTVMNLTYTQ